MYSKPFTIDCILLRYATTLFPSKQTPFKLSSSLGAGILIPLFIAIALNSKNKSS